MPIVRVEMWPGRTKAQKRELARQITRLQQTRPAPKPPLMPGGPE